MKRLACLMVWLAPLALLGCNNDNSSNDNSTSTNNEQPPTAAEGPLIQQWQTPDLRVPESVLYHVAPDQELLFVSEIDGAGDDADGQGGIALLSPDGSVINKDWVRGLDAPKGMGVHAGKLYVADLHQVVRIDIASATIEARIEVPESVFLNDIAINDDGVVYVSDTRTNKVHRIHNQTPEVFLENVEAANGLTFAGEDLYVGANDKLLKASPEGELTTVAEGFAERADGVEMTGSNEFIVSCWAGLIYHVSADGELTQLLDTRGQSNTADIGWNAEQQMLYVPTFNANSAVAYKFEGVQ